MSAPTIRSFGGVIYYMDEGEPRFLVIKRQSLAKKIEWTAPKGKPQGKETQVETAKREIHEETSIDPEKLHEEGKVGVCTISFENSSFAKTITYFLFEYTGDPYELFIPAVEGYIGIYKWLPISQALNVIPYSSLREVYRNGYQKVMELHKKK